MKTLALFYNGSAALLDETGATLWTSRGDDEFLAEVGEFVTIDEEDDILDYLEEAGHLEEGEEVETRDSEEDDDDDDDDDPDFEDDEDDDDDDDDELEPGDLGGDAY